MIAAAWVGGAVEFVRAQESPLGQQVHWKTAEVGAAVRELQFCHSGLLAVSDQAVLKLDSDNARVLGKLALADVKISDFCVFDDAMFLCGAYRVEYGFVARISLSSLDEAIARVSRQGRLDLEDIADWSKVDYPGPLTRVVSAGDTVCVGNEDGSVFALNSREGESRWAVSHHAKMVTALTVLRMPDDTMLLASGDWAGKIIVSDIKTGEAAETFGQHRDTITALRASSGAAGHLHSASRDGTLRLWYVHQSRLVRFVRQSQPVVALDSFSNGLVVGATRRSELLLVDTGSAEILSTVRCPLDYIHAVAASQNCIAISNGRQYVAIATLASP